MAGMTTLGVIFDMDGVLVDSTEAHYQSWKKIGEDIGHAYPRDVFMKSYGMHNRQSIPLWLGRAVPEDEIVNLAHRKEVLYREMARDTLQPIPGVIDLIKALHADGFWLAVGSSGPAVNVSMVLDLLGVLPLFKALSTGDDVKEGKPHPAIFLNAARKLGLLPIACTVIEDAPQGIEAARAAGMFAIAIPTSRVAVELAAADWIAASLTQVSPEKLRAHLALWRPASEAGH
jgi:beta-phosphoglucomutase